jgi:hypothetical protein
MEHFSLILVQNQGKVTHQLPFYALFFNKLPGYPLNSTTKKQDFSSFRPKSCHFMLYIPATLCF